MEEIAIELLKKKFFVKLETNYLSVIHSYKEELDKIAKEYQLELVETYKIGNSFQGVFKEII